MRRMLSRFFLWLAERVFDLACAMEPKRSVPAPKVEPTVRVESGPTTVPVSTRTIKGYHCNWCGVTTRTGVCSCGISSEQWRRYAPGGKA